MKKGKTITSLRISIYLVGSVAMTMFKTPSVETSMSSETGHLSAITSNAPSAPEGAPNVLVVLLDDVGFSAASTFGGAIPTPDYDKLANQGLRYNNFHTTAMCSPTRAALLTGRNHHQVEMAAVQNVAFGQPGYTSIIPDAAATLGDVLKLNGYSTAWFGKNHLTPSWEITPHGPFERWPSGFGFDYFYGFMDGATDQFDPDLVENTRFVDAPNDADYILDKDLADHVIKWLREQQSYSPDKPFFIYLAPGTAHVPLQAPKEWIEKFEGQFDQGWDVLNQQVFERQKAEGIIPADANRNPRPDSIPAWDGLSDKEKAVASRLMEVFAAQLAYFDHQFGRITDEIKRLNQWENTLVIYIDGDNGPAIASGIYGNMIFDLNPGSASVDYMYEHLDDMGGPRTFNGANVGWSWAMATPFPNGKTIASHLGGTRNGMVVSWPAKIKDAGNVRDQYLHITDVAPTIYDAIGITPPEVLAGVEQMPFDGSSFAATFENAESDSRHNSQYYEMLGNRGYYKDGWLANTTPPSLPWAPKSLPTPDQYEWELYNLTEDYSQSQDLADKYPEKLQQMLSSFLSAAARNKVLPINNKPGQRGLTSSLRPYVTSGRFEFEFYRTDNYMTNAVFPDVRNRHWAMSLSFNVPSTDAGGTLITQGGADNGWGLFMFDGVLTFIYKTNPLPGMEWRLSSDNLLEDGDHQVEIRVVPDSSSPGDGAMLSMSIDNQEPQTVHLDATVAYSFPMDDGVGIGRDFRQTLTTDYSIPFRYQGEIEVVKIYLDEAARALNL